MTSSRPERSGVPRRSAASLRRDLRFSSADATAFSLMVGAGETYIPAFALALGATDVVAGLASSVPLIAGAVLQLVSPRAVLRLGSHKRWVVLCAALQALSFLPLVIGAALGALPVWLLFTMAAAYWGTGMATGPTWNTWMESLLPRSLRTRYLARRARLAQLAILVGMVGGALLLGAGERNQCLLPAFALLFALAGLLRIASSVFLARQSEPDPIPSGFRMTPVRQLVLGVRRRADSHLLAYLLSVQVAVYVAAPFFITYMLGPLGLSYAQFMVLTGAAFVSKALVLPVLGNLGRRSGPRQLLWIGGVGITPLAALWTVSDHFIYLLAVQLVAGAVWAAFELAVLLLFFDSIPREERTSTLTSFNLANAVAILVGSALGAMLLARFGQTREAYAILFAVSTAGRLVCVLLLRRMPEQDIPLHTPVVRTLAVRPSLGGLDRPVLPSLSNGAEPDGGGSG